MNMGGFFNMDGPFYRVGNMVADIMILSLLWFVFSIPIVTIGASTTALFYVATKRISNKEGYLFRDFWKSFSSNFLQATITWVIIMVVGSLLLFNIININIVGDLKSFILPFQICFMVELLLVSIYIFPLISRFDMKMKELFKTAFLMANKHLLTSFLCVLVIVGVLLLIYYFGFFIVVAMGAYAFCSSFFLIKVFKKYRPELDSDDYLLEEGEQTESK